MAVNRLQKTWAEVAEKTEYEMNKALPRSTEPEGRLFKAMRYAALGGGKRLRALLVFSSARLFSVSDQAARKVAAAVEFVHAYSLIHDDLPCMDNSHLRRGRAATHIRYGEATALLAGNALLNLAFEVLCKSDLHEDPFVRIDLITRMARAAGGQGLIAGQTLDMLPVAERRTDIGSVTRLQRLKTGALFAFACESGAILGKASPDARQALISYAHDLGMAFQVVDDLLDVKGASNETGKPTGQDEDNDKTNFVTLMGSERAQTQATILSEQAVQHLKGFGKEADVLRDVAKFVVSRKN